MMFALFSRNASRSPLELYEAPGGDRRRFTAGASRSPGFGRYQALYESACEVLLGLHSARAVGELQYLQSRESIWRHQVRPPVEFRARNCLLLELAPQNYSYCSSHPERCCPFSALNSGSRGAAGLVITEIDSETSDASFCRIERSGIGPILELGLPNYSYCVDSS
eukprot:8907610-Pyramimonas_sp.AAC.1